MRIIPYDGDESLEDIESVSLLIKAIPFEDTFVPAYTLVAPSDDYFININEVNCLMDGIEIAQSKIDELIALMLQDRISSLQQNGILYDQDDEEDEWEIEEDDNGEGD
jgi:hypothetical protein